MRATPNSFELFESPTRPGELIHEGDRFSNVKIAAAFEALAAEGPDLFYRGEWAASLAEECAEHGGLITRHDLEDYRVERREPVVFRYRGARVAINPPPSPGGCLVAFALGVMSDWDSTDATWGSEQHFMNLLRGMRAASVARHDFSMEAGLDREVMERLLDPETIREWRSTLELHSLFSRGTTHISVADAEGNIASLTASNGEGCGFVLPGTGIMLNNMLGEEDLHPAGFNRWKEGARLASMMSPAIAETSDGKRIALGSGGANRIRSAVTQTLVNLLDFGMAPREAVEAPRIHLEGPLLSIEPGIPEPALHALDAAVPSSHHWPAQNLFFGGVHTVSVEHGGVFDGAGDPRRGGVVGFARR
jgi:gamma-glutamyltranspeptidase/glutathione hydrolase